MEWFCFEGGICNKKIKKAQIEQDICTVIKIKIGDQNGFNTFLDIS